MQTYRLLCQKEVKNIHKKILDFAATITHALVPWILQQTKTLYKNTGYSNILFLPFF
jgi:hypothetical protein